jgi:hypothetical protein
VILFSSLDLLVFLVLHSLMNGVFGLSPVMG